MCQLTCPHSHAAQIYTIHFKMISAKLGFEMKNSHPNVSFLTAFKLYLKVKIAMWETQSRATKNMNTILHNILFPFFDKGQT